MAIRCLEIQPVFVHPNAAIADVVAAVRVVMVMPDLETRTRVDGPNVIWARWKYRTPLTMSGVDFTAVVFVRNAHATASPETFASLICVRRL